MINKLKILIREILIFELGTFGATHPANVKKDKSDVETPEDQGSEQQSDEEIPS